MFGAGDSPLWTEQVDCSVHRQQRAFEFEAPRHVLPVVFRIDDDLQAIDPFGAVKRRLERCHEGANDLREIIAPHAVHGQSLPFEFYKPFHVATMLQQAGGSQRG